MGGAAKKIGRGPWKINAGKKGQNLARKTINLNTNLNIFHFKLLNLTFIVKRQRARFAKTFYPSFRALPTNPIIFGADAAENSGLPLFALAREWLEACFAGERPDPSGIPPAPAGSEFPRPVWSALLGIPYGGAAAYGEIEERVSCMSARAVGGAAGRNPISIIVPCHRVAGRTEASPATPAGSPARYRSQARAAILPI